MKISAAVGAPLNKLHFPMEALRNAVVFGEPPHGGDFTPPIVESSTPSEEFLKKHRDIVRLLKEKHSIRNAAKIAGMGISTVQKVKLHLTAPII